MSLKCHAIMKSGKMCGAGAHVVVNGHPACDRPKHYYGRCEFMPMTAESVRPNLSYDEAVVWVDFIGGSSIAQIARLREFTSEHVEAMLREAARLM